MLDLMPSEFTKGLICALIFAATTACGNPKNAGDSIVDETAAPSNSDVEIASVDGAIISLQDVDYFARAHSLILAGDTLDPDSPEFADALEQFIDQRLLADDAARVSLDQTVDSQRRLSMARERILSSIRVEAYLEEHVTAEDVRAVYDKQISMGRNMGTLETAEPDIRRLLTAQAIQDLLQTLRSESNVTRFKDNSKQDK